LALKNIARGRKKIMSHDVVADALNMIKNAKNAKKETIKIGRISNLLVEILKIMKQHGAIKKYKIDVKEKTLEVTIGDLEDCRSIKPRFTVSKGSIEKYRRRYLPARNIGVLVISTNKGLVTHEEALNEGIGGSLIAYFY
jgi:small subunit ribosomal protein S8